MKSQGCNAKSPYSPANPCRSQGHRSRRRRYTAGRLSCCALMGTVVHAGTAPRVVVATGRPPNSARSQPAEHTPARYRIPGRDCASSRCCWSTWPVVDHVDLPHQRAAAQTDHRRAAVLAGDRGWYYSTTPACRGLDQSRCRVAAHEPTKSVGQAAGLYRGPRQCRHALHRQDGHADPRPDRLHAGRAAGDSTPTCARMGIARHRELGRQRACGGWQRARSSALGITRECRACGPDSAATPDWASCPSITSG